MKGLKEPYHRAPVPTPHTPARVRSPLDPIADRLASEDVQRWASTQPDRAAELAANASGTADRALAIAAVTLAELAAADTRCGTGSSPHDLPKFRLEPPRAPIGDRSATGRVYRRLRQRERGRTWSKRLN